MMETNKYSETLDYKAIKWMKILPYQDVHFAVLTLNRESESASSRGEFHQALGNNALDKPRPVATEHNHHHVTTP